MRKTCSLLLLFCLVILSIFTSAQLPDTEIFLAEIKKVNGEWKFGDAENITNRPGYDNQPGFSPDDENLLFVQVVDSMQSDVYEYSFSRKSIRQITSSRESEYSPTFRPDHSEISVVRVDQDSAQRFYTFDPARPGNPSVIPGGDSVGYFCWLNDSLVAMFIVGKRISLEVLNTQTHSRRFIAWDIGRCMKLSPDKQFMYFTDKSDTADPVISSLRISDFQISQIIKSVPGSEDFSPLPDGSLIMGSAGKLYIFHENSGGVWNQVKDYTASIGPFYRITVNEKGTRIAFVAYAGKRP